MDLDDIDGMTDGIITEPLDFTPFGTSINVTEVSSRLSVSLYKQLSEGNTATTEAAISRAQMYVGAVLHRLGVRFNLDDHAVREIVLIHTIYELHIALGHEEAGREYRLKAKDMILAAWGAFPDSDQSTGTANTVTSPTISVKKPQRTKWGF